MPDYVLKFTTADGETGEVPLERSRTSFGRGDADHRFNDNGLSRIHASVCRDGDRVWVLDENSTNGTFVNGQRVPPNGTALREGDEIAIGNHTKIRLETVRAAAAPAPTGGPQPAAGASAAASAKPAGGDGQGVGLLLPLALIGVAVLVIGASAAFIGYKVFGGGAEIAEETPYDDYPTDPTPRPSRTPKGGASPGASAAPTSDGNSGPTPSSSTDPTAPGGGGDTQIVLPKGRYQDMSEEDKNRYIAARAEKVARIIGNQKSDPIPPEAVAQIKNFLAGYVSRLGRAKKDSCEPGSWIASDFNSVLNRATKTSPLVVRSFRAEGIEPQIGIYVAMIEGEHCPCLTSNTGAKGMFQFLASSSPDYGLPPDQRCDPEQSAKAGAKYLKSLIARFGTAPDSVPLAIASFNSGQGNLSKNLDTVFAASGGQNRSFWTLVANKGILEGGAGKQFVNENIKYVPKFFAAAIIGENPQDFGVSLQPLSTYTAK